MNDEGVIVTKTLFEPKPKNPVVICGLPGSGYVGKLAVEHLISIFDAKKFMEFQSPTFPPQANVGEDGVVHPVRGEFYHAETGQGNDLLLFTADAQPNTSNGEYELSEIVLREGKRLGAGLVISLAAYITGNFAEEQRVYGASSSKETGERLSENGVKMMKDGAITGMNGLIIGMASLNGMDGMCLLGETSGYMIDPSASQHVLEALGRILNLKIDLSTLAERAVEAKELMGQIQKMAGAGQEGEEESGAFRPGSSKQQPGYIG
jgi:uncharacterized protein